MRELTPLPARRSWRDAEGRTVYDFGQNIGGYVAFSTRGDAGARILVEHAEILDKHGIFDSASLRSAESLVEYMLKGGETEGYRPYFTFQGFRYARVAIIRQSRDHRDRCRPDQLGHQADRKVLVRSSAGQSARREHRLVAARQFHRSADGLSATRRAPRLDGRRPGLRRRRLLPARQPQLPAQMAARRHGRPARRRGDRACRPRPDAAARGRGAGLLRQHRLGRCDLRRALDALRALRRSRRARRDPAGDGPLGRLRLEHQRRPDRPAAAVAQGTRRHLRRLAAAERAERKAAADLRRRHGRDPLPLHLVDAHRQGGASRRQ